MPDEQHKRNIAVGLTAAAGLIGLAGLLALFGYVPGFLEDGYTYQVEIPESGGLYPDSRVTFYGIDVGKVTEVNLRTDDNPGVIATILIDLELPKTIKAEVKATSLLGGGSAINFTRNDDIVETNMLPTDGTGTIKARIASPIDGLTSALEEPMQRFDDISQDLNRLLIAWSDLGENLNKLVEPRPAGSQDATGNLAAVLAETEASLAEARHTLSSFRELVDDPQLIDDLKSTAANTRKLTDRAEGTLQAIEDTAASLERRMAAVADDLSGAIASASGLLTKVHEGAGTAGKLISDPALYDNLNDAAERLKTTLLELRLLVEKIQAEGVLSSL
ncbi:MAG: MlaD family protein [Phycisphaeraceae bacterium]